MSILAVLLAAMLAIGLRGRMIDDDPRCSRCRYNLTSLTAQRCPECGTQINAGTVRFRRRVRSRPVLISAGVAAVALALSGASLAGVKSLRLNWYPYYPLDWLLSAAARDIRPAGEELSRRVRTEMLSPAELDKVTRTAMEHQTKTYPAKVPEVWANVLGMLEVAGRLSEEDREAFLGSLVWAEVKVRERVRVWEPLVLQVRYGSRGGRSVGHNFRVVLTDLKPGRGSWWLSPPNNWELLNLEGSEAWCLKSNAIAWRKGDHILRGELRAAITDPTRSMRTTKSEGDTTWTFDDGSGEILVKTVPVERPYRVIPTDAPDPVHLVVRPDLQRRLRRILTVEEVQSWAPSKPNTPKQHSRVVVCLELMSPFDFDLAFDAAIEIGKDRIPAGEISWAKGETGRKWIGSKRFTPRDVDRFNVILRSSRDVAIHTVDCYDIWDGEIVIRDVPVR